MKSILGLSLFFSTIAMANIDVCDIETYDKLIVIHQNNDVSFIKKTNCPAETIQAVSKFIKSVEGKITGEHLNQMLSDEKIANAIALSPYQIEVSNLDKLIGQKLTLENGLVAKDANFVGTKNVLTLTAQDQISFECNQCELLGEHNIKLIISNPISSSDDQVYWARAQILKKINAYRAKEEIGAKAADNFTQSLEPVEITVTKPELYLTDINDLKFYRPIHSFKKGDLIKLTDISPVVLVKTGSRVKVKIENKNLNLISTSLANKSGIYGDSIELTNVNSKRKLVGRIVDYNTVVIDL